MVEIDFNGMNCGFLPMLKGNAKNLEAASSLFLLFFYFYFTKLAALY